MAQFTVRIVEYHPVPLPPAKPEVLMVRFAIEWPNGPTATVATQLDVADVDGLTDDEILKAAWAKVKDTVYELDSIHSNKPAVVGAVWTPPELRPAPPPTPAPRPSPPTPTDTPPPTPSSGS